MGAGEPPKNTEVFPTFRLSVRASHLLKGDLSKEDKQKFLLNTVEEIGVSLDKETNDHHLTINFRMGLVDDGIQYADETRKSGGYELIEGEKQRDMVISKDQVHQMHQSARVSKKKQTGHYWVRSPSFPATP